MKYNNLQAVYCGLRDRKDDGYTFDPIDEKFSSDFATYALTKACFNVLGHPYEYLSKVAPGKKSTIPHPDRFFKGNLSVQQLIDVDFQA